MRNTRENRRKRREESEARMAEHKKLSIKERINKAKSRRGKSTKEIFRLEGLLEKEKHHKKNPKAEKSKKNAK